MVDGRWMANEMVPNDLSFLSRERAEIWAVVWSRDKKLG